MSNPRATDRLTFRRLRECDVDRLVDLDADPEVMRYLTGGVPTPRARVEQVVARVLSEYARGIPGRWLAFDAGGGFVGWFGLDPDGGRADEREIGYRLRRPYWRRGLATEGGRELLRLGFAELGLERVWGQTMAVNAGSRAVMAALGLRPVRTFFPHFGEPIAGSEHGEVEYEIRRTDWLTGRIPGTPCA